MARPASGIRSATMRCRVDSKRIGATSAAARNAASKRISDPQKNASAAAATPIRRRCCETGGRNATDASSDHRPAGEQDGGSGKLQVLEKSGEDDQPEQRDEDRLRARPAQAQQRGEQQECAGGGAGRDEEIVPGDLRRNAVQCPQNKPRDDAQVEHEFRWAAAHETFGDRPHARIVIGAVGQPAGPRDAEGRDRHQGRERERRQDGHGIDGHDVSHARAVTADQHDADDREADQIKQRQRDQEVRVERGGRDDRIGAPVAARIGAVRASRNRATRPNARNARHPSCRISSWSDMSRLQLGAPLEQAQAGARRRPPRRLRP